MVRLMCVAVVVCASSAVLGQDDPVEYEGERTRTLSDPTPREMRRELSADRPDFTESPITVDAGVVQVELSFFDYSRNGRAETFTLAPTNLKLGLTSDMDLQFVFEPYVDEDDGARDADGFGDIQVRLKKNIWGNDGGRTALAVMPFVKIPTASDDLGNDHVEGGFIVPFSVEVTDRVGVGLMGELDLVYDDGDDDYDVEFIVSGVIGYDLTERLGGYAELVLNESTESDRDLQSILGVGATYSLSPDAMLDVGVNFGLGGDADDVNLFAGMTIRY
ncbi:MAG: transporter [Phycisphaerales bacterium JB043]